MIDDNYVFDGVYTSYVFTVRMETLSSLSNDTYASWPKLKEMK